MDQNEEFDN